MGDLTEVPEEAATKAPSDLTVLTTSQIEGAVPLEAGAAGEVAAAEGEVVETAEEADAEGVE